LRFGRYVVLEGDADGLFGWMEDQIGRDWAVRFRGMSPVKEPPIPGAVFDSAAELRKFETVFLGNQVNQGLVYTGRRAAGFEGPSSEERRGNLERRRLRPRRPDRQGRRRRSDRRTSTGNPSMALGGPPGPRLH